MPTPEQQAELDKQRKELQRAYGQKAGNQIADKIQQEVATKETITQVDPGAYMYGGSKEAAGQAAARYQGLAEQAQQRQGEVVNYGQAEQTRNSAMGMAGLMEARARGQVPSIAQMQADRQMGQAAAEQSSAAASARGPAGLALAQQGAAANTAAMQSNISGQAQINGANERMQAEQAAFGAYGSMRGQDAQQAQFQSQLNAQQRAQNDAYASGMYGNEIQVNTTQLGANMQQQGAKQQGALAYQNLVAQRKAGSDKSDQQALQTGAAVAGTAAMMMSDVNAKQNVSSLGGSSSVGGMFAPVGQPIGVAGVGGMYGGGGAGAAGMSMTQPIPGAPTSHGFDWKGLGSGLMGISQSFGPGGMMLSDARAKEGAFQMGQAAGMAMSGADPRAAAWDEGHASALKDMQALSKKSPEELRQYGDHPLALAVRGLKADAWDEGRSHRQGPSSALMQQGQGMLANDQAQQSAMMGAGPSVSGDPVTAQFAEGLAPSSYDYKPGMGTPGHKVGPMAQNMAANPVTATAINQDPQSGLLGIDRDDGLKVALAAGGHNAQKVQELERRIAEMQQSTQAQGQGLLAQGPSIGQQYLATVRGGR